MKKSGINKMKTTKATQGLEEEEEEEVWHECSSNLPFKSSQNSKDNIIDVSDLNSSKNSVRKTQAQNKAQTTRKRNPTKVTHLMDEVHAIQTSEHNSMIFLENFNLPHENPQVVNNSDRYENLLSEISAENKKPKSGTIKKISVEPPSPDVLLLVECNSQANNTKTPQRRSTSKSVSTKKSNGSQLEEIVNILGDLDLSQEDQFGDSTEIVNGSCKSAPKDISVENKPKRTYKPRKLKSKDEVDMPVSVDKLTPNEEGGSCLLKETFAVNKPQKITKPRKSKENVAVEKSECCSTDNMDVVSVTESETKTKPRSRKGKKTETSDSPSTPVESLPTQNSLTDQPESLSNISIIDDIPSSSSAPGTDDNKFQNLKGKRKLLEDETLTPKRDKQTEIKEATVTIAPNKTVRKKKGVLNIIVKKGIVEIDDNCKIPTYKTNSTESRGNVLLISNANFTDPSKNRKGGDIDYTNITNLFKEMGFSITAHQDKTAQGMKNIVQHYCQDPALERADIQITVIMSHGTQKENKLVIQGTDLVDVDIEWIVDKFSNIACHHLAAKPKIFILQCCRGGDKEHEKTDGDIIYISSANARKNSDILIAYSTTKAGATSRTRSGTELVVKRTAYSIAGQVAYRNEVTGSRYINTICNVFMENAHDTNVEDLLKIVDKNINTCRLSSRALQTCTYENRGFKRCYLNPI